jgi:iron complex outermembrane recepter protein
LGPPNFANAYRVQDDEESYSSTTPSATIDYQPTDDVYLYATYSKGFKSGGYNIGGSQAAFDAEKITDYEIGAKADWLERRLRTNLALFYYDYKDIQANRIDVQQLVTFNAPGAKVKGAELEVQAAPIDPVSIDASFSWLGTEYKGPFATLDTARPWAGLNDLAGNQLTQAPKYTFNFGAQYTWAIGEGDLTLRGETQYKDRVYFSVFNLPYVSQPSHWISNAFLNFDSGTNWTANLFVRNIEDKLVRVAENVSPGFWGTPVYGAFAPPRTYGVEVGYRVR